MNKSQYKRFFFVLFLPLLVLGWWSAENNIFFDDHIVQCMKDSTGRQYECHSWITSPGSWIVEPDLFLWNGAILHGGFHEKVALEGLRVLEDDKNGIQQEVIIRAGGVETITVGGGIHGYRDDVCTLSPVSDTTGSDTSKMAALRCSEYNYGIFSFLDKKTAEKYQNLFVIAKEEVQKNSTREKYSYVVSILLPLTIFLLGSGVIYLLINLSIKIALFVRYGIIK